ncbi:hypothetical protein O181_057168 [Austropuccinia psidii MF-1]|uniref:Uncharacterized protein n=1 Tax=Austropuccinia psidii MF-1 TaxID=1389203 RepID=A0A9Q3EEH5_9BASI|nr:hypothetical protein [Austropuccinia psidii MF-1]
MTIVHKYGNMEKNSDHLSRWALPNAPDNTAYVSTNAENKISIEGTKITEIKDSYGFTHDWCTLIPELELSYKISIHASTGKTPGMLEKGWNPKIPVYALKKDLVYLHPAASRFQLLLDKLRHNENQSITDSFEYAEKKWDKSHKTPEFK